MASAPPFSLGLTYWPRRDGPLLWRRFDGGAVREELLHIAALGCDTVRLSLTWEDFQPAPARIGAPALRALERTLDAVHEAGLRAALLLFPCAQDGVLQLPLWANGADVVAQLRRAGGRAAPIVVRTPSSRTALSDGRYRPLRAENLFDDPELLAAQRYLIDEVAGYFGAHPAAWAWQLGEGFERIVRPERAVARAWLERAADDLRRAAPGATLLAAVSAASLRTDGLRPEDLAAADLLGVCAEPPELPADGQKRHTDPAAFLHALAAGLAGRRAIVTALGMPLAAHAPGWGEADAYGRRWPSYAGSEAEQASFVDAALERLRRDGAAGVWLSAYADYPQELWGAPPLDRAERARASGLVDASGREKASALALRSFAQALARDAREQSPPPAVDGDRYWRDPAQRFAELWREFTSAA